MKPTITKTIVQTLDSEGKVLSEKITTVEETPVGNEDDTYYGLYL